MTEEAVANNGNDLIVGFSDQRRPTASNTDSKQVSFSQDIAIVCFQYPSTEEVSKRWYSKRDKSFFNQEMQHDIRSIRYQLSITPVEALEEETLCAMVYGCIGLEAHLSSKEVTRFFKEKKQGHARSIVEMQDCVSDEQLAAYAEARSSESIERAQKLAAGYSSILS